MLIETICYNDGAFQNLGFHEARMHEACRSLFGEPQAFALQEALRTVQLPAIGLFKVRMVYDLSNFNISCEPYSLRTIGSLKIVHDDEITYAHKFVDRSQLNRLFEQRGDCDEVIIVRKGKVTDATVANLIFRKGSDWATPANALLHGTMRSKLLREGVVREMEIRGEDIHQFDACRLINAMFGLELPEIPVSKIVF